MNDAGRGVAPDASATRRLDYDFLRTPLRARAQAPVQPQETTAAPGGGHTPGSVGVLTGGVSDSQGAASLVSQAGGGTNSPDVADEEASTKRQGGSDDDGPVLKLSPVAGPTTTDCGGFDWTINWELDKPAEKAGVIVQEISREFELSDCMGQRNIYPERYWEKWDVEKGSDRPNQVGGASYDDIFQFVPKPGLVNKGKVTMTGEAQFYPGQNPTGFTVIEGSQAKALPMSTTNPGLTGGTGLVGRSIIAEWNCCSDSEDQTTTVAHYYTG